MRRLARKGREHARHQHGHALPQDRAEEQKVGPGQSDGSFCSHASVARLRKRTDRVVATGVALSKIEMKDSGPSTRDMERINWLEFREWVPEKIKTVLLPLGTLEAHGVTANGTDIVAPVAMARSIAARLNAMIAPVIAYGFTGVLDAYPGSFTVPEEPYAAYVRAVLVGLARNKFKNIVMLNGHG